VRSSAADVLGKIGGDQAIPELLKLVEHSDYFVRSSAADALGKIGDDQAIPGLLKLVEDSDSDVRSSAADALGKIGDDQAIPELLKLVEDSDSGVRWSAADALGNIAKHHTEKVAVHLPELLNLIPSASGKEVHRAILAIQAACKYYKYEIRQLSLAPDIGRHPAKVSASVYIQSPKEVTVMSNQSPIFNQNYATIGVNYAAENSNPKFIQKIEAVQQSSPEAALKAVVQIIQELEKNNTEVQDEQEARKIIDAEFKEIKEQKPIEWQNLISLPRLYNGGKNAAVKVCEHFAESSPWAKGFVGFIEGISEDVD
jgi:HEAT repeat protein